MIWDVGGKCFVVLVAAIAASIAFEVWRARRRMVDELARDVGLERLWLESNRHLRARINASTQIAPSVVTVRMATRHTDEHLLPLRREGTSNVVYLTEVRRRRRSVSEGRGR